MKCKKCNSGIAVNENEGALNYCLNCIREAVNRKDYQTDYEKAWGDLIEFLETAYEATRKINDTYHNGMGAGFNSVFKKMREIINDQKQ